MTKQQARDEWIAGLTGAALTLRDTHPQLAYWVGLARDEIQKMPLPGEPNGWLCECGIFNHDPKPLTSCECGKLRHALNREAKP